jgi:hypothetical protein
MVLISIVGELGGGKTASLTYLAWNNYYYKERLIFSNYNIYGIPFHPVKTLDDLEKMIPAKTATAEELLNRKEIFFAGDELWRWIDSRTALFENRKEGRKINNKVVTDILGASRKQGVTIAYSTQTLAQVDPRIRNVTDFIFYPILLGDNDMCRISVFRGPRASIGTMMPDIRYFTEPIFAMFNTHEIVEPLIEGDESVELVLPLHTNPALIRTLVKDRHFSDENIQRYCNKILKDILRPDQMKPLKEVDNQRLQKSLDGNKTGENSSP